MEMSFAYPLLVYCDVKVFLEGLMVDMASKNSSSYTVSYTSLPMETDFHF